MKQSAFRRDIGRLGRWSGLLTLVGVGLLLLSACLPGTYQMDIFPEQHYQQSVRRSGPPRLTPPDGAVPITGAEVVVTSAQANALKNPCASGCGPDIFSVVPSADAAAGFPYSGTLAAPDVYHDSSTNPTAGNPSTLFGMGAFATLPNTSDVVQHGAEVYRVNCSMCHGPSAQGNGTVGDKFVEKDYYVRPPNLTAATTQDRTDGGIFYIITNGVVVMPKFGLLLNEQDRWSAVMYLRYLAQQSAGAPKG